MLYFTFLPFGSFLVAFIVLEASLVFTTASQSSLCKETIFDSLEGKKPTIVIRIVFTLSSICSTAKSF